MSACKKLIIAGSFLGSGCAGAPSPTANHPDNITVASAPLPQTPPTPPSDMGGGVGAGSVAMEDEAGEADGDESSQLPQPSTLTLCEPIGDRWDYPSKVERKQIKSLIGATCKAMGVSGDDCKYFSDIISLRESSYRPWVRHRLSGDVAAALSSYMRSSHAYGWSVRWPRKSRRAEDVTKIEFAEYGPSQNPYYTDPARWMFGLGLGGLNISYHLSKFDAAAPPEILCDTVINVMIQVTIARNAVSRYGARNFVEIQAVYAGRVIHDDDGRAHPLSCVNGCPSYADSEQVSRARKGDAGITKRCKRAGLDCSRAPQLGSSFTLDSMSVTDRYNAAESVRGSPLPPFDVPSIHLVPKSDT